MGNKGRWMTFDESGKIVPAVPLVYDEDTAYQLFSDALVAVKKSVGREAPGNPFSIGAISYPSHFNLSCKTSLGQAAIKFDTLFIEEWLPWRYLDSFNAVRFAYALDTCAGLGLQDTACTSVDSLPPQDVVLVERNQDSLSFVYREVYGSDGIQSEYYVQLRYTPATLPEARRGSPRADCRCLSRFHEVEIHEGRRRHIFSP